MIRQSRISQWKNIFSTNKSDIIIITTIAAILAVISSIAIMAVSITHCHHYIENTASSSRYHFIVQPDVTRTYLHKESSPWSSPVFYPQPDNAIAPQWIHSGMPIRIVYPHQGQSEKYKQPRVCSLGAVIDSHTALTAGHCVQHNDAYVSVRSRTGDGDVIIGKIDYSRYDDNSDSARIVFNNTVHPNDVAVNAINSSPLHWGEEVFKYGATSKTTRGQVTRHIISDTHTTLCSMRGDSGSAVWNNHGEVVGIVSITHDSSENIDNYTCGDNSETIIIPIGDVISDIDDYDKKVLL